FYDVMDYFEYQRIDSPLKVHINDILELVREFSQASDLFFNTGGAHSTGLAEGKEILLFHEDVGRHNALDKVIGESFMKGMVLKDKMIITSGRISSEMLIKCAKRGIPIVISRAAPMDLALQLGEKIGMTIIGFARGSRFNIYTHPQRICMK
ncbi:MAG TPA: formate dehydrogenase accessory sulfurtransferase FdhD, partial [Clostridiales bacterium]|nr:formate dehydrogenase accessory sulfurtransferase FdhD [Clostridiales bacterium]